MPVELARGTRVMLGGTRVCVAGAGMGAPERTAGVDSVHDRRGAVVTAG